MVQDAVANLSLSGDSLQTGVARHVPLNFFEFVKTDNELLKRTEWSLA